MKRRQFIQLSAIGMAGPGLPCGEWVFEKSPGWKALAQPELLTLVGKRCVVDIGSLYRCAFPAEQAVEPLLAALLSDSVLTANLADPDLHSRLDQKIRDDFARGETGR